MKQLLILSGKGGTGKTTVATAFIKLKNTKVYADCDVDAPNLHLIMAENEQPSETSFCGMPKAIIDSNKCVACGACKEKCRFEAISAGSSYSVNLLSCEGCGVCELVCPSGAVTLAPHIAGLLQLYSKGRLFSTAELKMGSGNSGKLVSEVKKQIKDYGADEELSIIDGSPGIGCPVIASISGADMVLIVAEPTVSGISDMKRIIEVAKRFGVKTGVCINKYDINVANTERIEEFCQSEGITVFGKIPFDSNAVKAINSGKTITEIDCSSGKAVRDVFDKTMEFIFKTGGR